MISHPTFYTQKIYFVELMNKNAKKYGLQGYLFDDLYLNNLL